MPNWVYNHLTITADEDTAKKIHNTITEKDESGKERITYRRLLPMPESVEDTVSGGTVSMGAYLLVNKNLYGLVAGSEENNDFSNLYKDMENRLKETIVYNPDQIKDNEYKNLSDLTDMYLMAHPGQNSVTYGELVDWIETLDTTSYTCKLFLDSMKESLKEARKQINNAVKYGAPSWYEWAIMNWGVKWDASDSETYEENGTIVYRFNSPWGTPDPVFYKLSEMFPDAEIHLSSDFEMEPYQQNVTWLGGKIVHSEEIVTDWYDNNEDCYKYEELENTDPYFGQWYYEHDLSTDFYCPENSVALNARIINATSDEWTVEYTLKKMEHTKPIEYGTVTGGTYPASKGGLEIIKEDLIASKDKLEKHFGHLMNWWFNKPKKENKAVKCG